MARFLPATLAELRDAVAEALAADEPLEIVGGGSKRGLGRPLQLPHTLDLSRLAGIREYEPSELVLTAGAATSLAEIDAALADRRQMLAFEPPDWDMLYGLPPDEVGHRTLGGVLACNLAGPRRPKIGAARDHFLGFRAVSGRGETFKAGGKVVKNVTGYDLAKLLAGSFGTLAVLEEVTVKVVPRPESAITVLVRGLDAAAATRVMRQALGSPHEVSGAAYLPAGVTAAGVTDVVALRVEGPTPSVAFRRDRLLIEFASASDTAILDDAASGGFWRAVADAAPFAGLTGWTLWRVSVAPSRGALLGEAIGGRIEAVWYLDWGGGLLWLAVDHADDGGAAVIRAAIRGPDGGGSGHATLIRGAASLRRAIAVFEPPPPAVAALSARIRQSFDPHRVLNRGRMVEEA
jgi:glycolate dehydrogenase FAD-binding subunit